MDLDLDLVAKGLANRLTEIQAALDRYSGFAFRPGAGEPPPPGLQEGETAAAAREMVLRALAAAADPRHEAVLGVLARGDATLGELASTLDLPRLSVWERVKDLVQVGLVAHDLDGDRAGLTPAGEQVVALVDHLATSIARQVAR